MSLWLQRFFGIVRCPLCAGRKWRSQDWMTLVDLSTGEAVWVCCGCAKLVKVMRKAAEEVK